MLQVIAEIRKNEHQYMEVLKEEGQEFFYRKERYDSEFSFIAIYCECKIAIDFNELKKRLRSTDKFITLNDKLHCIIQDSVDEEHYIKAAENINYNLLHLNSNNDYYISTIHSKEYEAKDYANMIYELFCRLEDALENNLKNIVVYQDFVI
ncbi:hypothetical protein [Sulfurimonas sp. ST-27]|uniref:hypothetical protein n=1 Tax=Sulfurimonas sp. ST-27 TaxID=3400152 RepID=UPI003AB51116